MSEYSLSQIKTYCVSVLRLILVAKEKINASVPSDVIINRSKAQENIFLDPGTEPAISRTLYMLC